ncbi:MAG: cell wall hydrolase [Lachnospiraceae bacterium]
MKKQKHLPQKHIICLICGILLILVSVFALPELFSEKAEAKTISEQSDNYAESKEEASAEKLMTEQQNQFTEQAEEKLLESMEWTSEPETREPMELLTAESIWSEVYHIIMYKEGFSTDTLLAMALAEAEDRELQLLADSGDHLVTYGGERFVITDDDYQVLLRIVESEAPAEDIKGKMLIANVVLNRVLWESFPDTIGEVVFQKGQFAPIASGYYWKVEISESTIEAVERVLAGEDESEGALFFMAREKSKPKNVEWFDKTLKYLFKHGGHEFFTVK